jgi:hypothetical protein
MGHVVKNQIEQVLAASADRHWVSGVGGRPPGSYRQARPASRHAWLRRLALIGERRTWLRWPPMRRHGGIR